MLAEIGIAGLPSTFFLKKYILLGKEEQDASLHNPLGMSVGEESVGNSQTALGVGGQDWILAVHG